MSRLTPALLLMAAIGIAVGGTAPCPARADEAAAIGRIFLTPEQRRLLDQRRQTPGAQMDSELPPDLLPARTATTRRVVLNGIVRRGQQAPVVWINGERADLAPAGRQDVQVHRGPDRHNRVTVQVERTGTLVRLKPGQAWDPVSGKVTDCAQCGQLPPVPTPEPTAQLSGPDTAAESAVASTAEPGAGPRPAPGSP